ncbi:MAG: PepSY domain-containing protein [Betaproteobacteria bacterium]
MWFFSLIFCAFLAQPGFADDLSDHDRARQALQAGEILPLKMVLEKVERDTPGSVLEVELDRKDERWVYEIKLLLSGGARVKLWVDARDGKIIARRNRNDKASH